MERRSSGRMKREGGDIKRVCSVQCCVHVLFQSFSLPKSSPLAMVAPSELNAQQLTGLLCPSSVTEHAVVASHSFTLLSMLQESKRLPSIELNAHPHTQPLWHVSVRRHSPVVASHNFKF